MAQVGFSEMAQGTAADYELLDRLAADHAALLPERVLEALLALEGSFEGCQVSRLTHSLQAATRARRDGRDDEYVIASLLHDLGDQLAPHNHGDLAASIVRPFVREELVWVVRHHGVFQLYYYAHHLGGDRDAREAFREHPSYDLCVEFCELYDQNSFDPRYDTAPLADFEPMLRRVLAEPRYLGPGFG